MTLAATATSDIVFLFAAAGLVLYIASRAAVDAVTSPTDPSPGKMALAHWMPIALTGLIATLAGHAEVGLGVAFATSVASIGLVLGVLLCVTPETGQTQSIRASAWPFVVPAAILALLAGFSGTLSWFHAMMLLGLGVCVVAVWRAPANLDDHSSNDHSPVAEADVADPPPLARQRYAGVQLVLAIALGLVGGWLGYKATLTADDQTRVATSGLISLAVLSPLLVLPMLGTGAIAAHHGKLHAALATVVGVILLNLCLLVPLVIAAHYVNQLTVSWPGGERTWEAIVESVKPLRYPLAVWRVDTVLLIVLGLLLIPVSLGRWRLQRVEGLGLTFVYAAYLIVSTILAVRL